MAEIKQLDGKINLFVLNLQILRSNTIYRVPSYNYLKNYSIGLL